MRKIIRVGAFAVAGMAGVAMIGIGVIYARSHLVITKTYPVPLSSWTAATDARAVAEGERLARIRGCYGGCHGTRLEGKLFWDEPGVATIAAPNLTAIVRQYSDPELERAIRRGVRQNGRSVFAMPSDMFAGLADEDLQAIIAFLRSQPEEGGIGPITEVGLIGRVGLTIGLFKPMASGIPDGSPAMVPRHDPVAWGRYLVRTSCTECHGMDLRGDGTTPDLAIAGAFSEEAWEALMTQGTGLGGRDLGLMGGVARSRFAYLTPAERGAVHTYLKAMAGDSTLRSRM
jgi:cytochrome c553